MDPGLEDLVRSRYERLRRAAYVLTGDTHSADDLVQNTLVRAVRHWSKLRQASDVDGYLYTMLLHTYRGSLRRRWRGEIPTDALPEGIVDERPAVVLEREALRSALMSLSPAHREVVVLRFMADWSEAQCAEALRCSVGTVKSRTSRALAALRASDLMPVPGDES